MIQLDKTKINFWLELGLVLLLVFALSIQSLSAAFPALNPPGRDGGFFNYVGKALNSGAILYQDIWDSKGPMIFWINALGMGNQFSRWGVYLIEILFWGAALFIAYLTIKKQYGLLPALGTVFVGHALFNTVIGPGNYTEEYTLLFTWIAIGALVLFIAKPTKPFMPFFLMGTVIVFNFLLRANNIGTQAMVILVALIYAIINKKEVKIWQAFLFLFIGIAIILIPVIIYFAIQGTLKAMLDASIFYNFHYSLSRGNPFSNSWQPTVTLFGWWNTVFLGIWLIVFVIFIVRAFKKIFDPFLLLIILAFPIEILMSSISGRGYKHYFICWVPICMLLFAFTFSVMRKEVISKKFQELCESKHTVPVLAIILVIVMISSFNAVDKSLSYIHASIRKVNYRLEFREPVAKVINDLTTETDKVLVFGGQAGINIMAERDSINTALFYPNINDSDIGIAIQSHFFSALKTSKPKLIIDGYRFIPQELPAIDPNDRANQRLLYKPSRNVDRVLEWINTNYKKYDEANDYIIYMLKDENP